MGAVTVAPRGESVVRRWARVPRSVGLARAELARALGGWGLGPVEEPALLVLSELMTNAVRHARVRGRDVESRFVRLEDGVRIEVHDASNTRPVPTSARADLCGGRGLVIVEAVADRWGVSARRGPGKVVWAVVTG